MPYPRFPDIQSPDMNGGVQEETYRPLRRTEFEGNTAAVRARSVRARKRWAIKWSKLPQADYETLREFFETRQGTPFSWTNQADGYQYLAVFSDDQFKASSVIYDGSTASMRHAVQLSIEEYAGEWQFAPEGDDGGYYDGAPIVLELFVTPGQEVQFTADATCLVDWGDGDPETDIDDIAHEYAAGGRKTLAVTPTAGLTELNFSGLGLALVGITRFDVPETVTSFRRMFKGTSLKSLPVFNLHHNAVADVSEEFAECLILESLGGLANPDSVANAASQFEFCTSLKYLNGFANGAATADCSRQFYCCYALQEVPDYFRNAAAVVTMAQQFSGCHALEYAPFRNVFPAGKTPLNVRWAFSGCTGLEGYVPPERTWKSRRTFGHNSLAAPFLNCKRVDNYYDMPPAWSGADFTQGQEVTATFVNNSGIIDGSVDGEFTFRLVGDETGEFDVPATFVDGIAPAVTLIRGGEYQVIPPEGYVKVFRARIFPGMPGIVDRSADLDHTFTAGQGLHSVELLAVPDNCRALFKAKFTSDQTHRKAKVLFYKMDTAGMFMDVLWGDDTHTDSTGVSASTWSPEHTYNDDGEYIVMAKGTRTQRLMLSSGGYSNSTADALANTRQIGEHIVELYYFGCPTTCTRAFMNCKFTSLPDGFAFPSDVNNIKETFYNVPLASLPDGLFDSWTSGSKNVMNAFCVTDGDTGSFAIPALWSRTNVTFTNIADCFTGRVASPGFRAAVANGWATDPPVDAADERSEVRTLAAALGTAAEDLHTALDEGGLDEDGDWRPTINAIEAMRKTAAQIAWHQWRYANADNLLPIYASQWIAGEDNADIHTEFIDVTPGTEYLLGITAFYKIAVFGYDANGDRIQAEGAVFDNTTGAWTPATAVKAVVAITAPDAAVFPTQELLEHTQPVFKENA